MSSSTTTSPPPLPTEGSMFGALKYNLNEAFGWRFGEPSQNEIILYSDLAVNISSLGAGYYIFNQDSSKPLFFQYQSYPDDETLANLVSTYLTYNSTVFASTFSPSDYSNEFANKDGLFNFKFFPWNVYGLKNTDGNYCVKNFPDGTYIQANPMSKSVLLIKMFTLLKLFGISFGMYALFKLLYAHMKKK